MAPFPYLPPIRGQKNTLRTYDHLLSNFQYHFGDIDLSAITSEQILTFLSELSTGTKPSTKRLRFTLLSAFFNFIRDSFEPELQNPCYNQALRKMFRTEKLGQAKILEKDVVDEIIFRTVNPRNRLMLELMARGGMRIGEVLKLTPNDIEGRKAFIREPKSGKRAEVVFLPHKVSNRLLQYIREKGIGPDERIIPIAYGTARVIVKKAGEMVDVRLQPHDLRRHAATYASRAGTPLEIVSKVILRHSNLQTTQRYLGKVSDVEAMRWIDSIHG